MYILRLLSLYSFLNILRQSSGMVNMPINDGRSKEKVFIARIGFALNDRVTAKYHVDSSLECTFHCISHSRCKSFNLKSTNFTGKHRCELNNATKKEKPSLYLHTVGSTYYEIEPIFFKKEQKEIICQEFRFTTLGASGRLGPTSLGNHYHRYQHQVTLINGTQKWTVPITGQYRIEAVGASGGYDVKVNSSRYRGFGAQMVGTFSLAQNEVLKILVGQKGETSEIDFTSGGGGGSFVARGRDPLIVAGGGGGSFGLHSRHPAYCDAGTNTSGRNGYGGMAFSGGTGGHGATTTEGYSEGAGGGGGFYSGGRSGTNFGGANGTGGEGGKGFLTGGTGGRAYERSATGGFGGGGGSDGIYAGGGGGGYSGGASGDNSASSCGGGGGSYNAGTDQRNACCFNGNGHGYVYVWRFCSL